MNPIFVTLRRIYFPSKQLYICMAVTSNISTGKKLIANHNTDTMSGVSLTG
jgi:hypothetical protein